ncbi:alpha/beta hydrolase [Deinococcus metallilatus]|uniref:Alpha-beta hydrolase superfamily lysophospholipase n=1 Tax=Deinococcus metallilatus TaxID=1211322 RepID=A0AAJ5F3D5_9DEIO|nr:alpha/beta hydrolase [Deinococcus metallilatus]MBB5294135.1 alpha-beta hydrolase superfamily lysophospholipase [Deinococcus metallilatus]QBY08918.1 alpha/beta hydrolase [Deinococcus metallilatus]RXJ10062.1 alpha/beta hydrolase [Deinococcus metallilatus]TLK28001.1 alpha/beta hydrolase [Deinococcus metallilatus]GMA16529.1 hypothetical protein GCM10025871_28600 [Deinococcus metallilatus]
MPQEPPERHLRLVLDDDLNLDAASLGAYAGWQAALAEAARAGPPPPRVLLAAHGGLVSQTSGEAFAGHVRELDEAGWTVTFITRTGLEEALDRLTNTHLFSGLVRVVGQLLALYRRSDPAAFFPLGAFSGNASGPVTAPTLDAQAQAREQRLLADLQGLIGSEAAGDSAEVRALVEHWQAHPADLRSAVKSAAQQTAVLLGQHTWQAVQPAVAPLLQGADRDQVSLSVQELRAALATTAAAAADPNALEAYLVEQVIRTVFPPPRTLWQQMKDRMAALVRPGAVGTALLGFLDGLPPLRVALVGHSLGGILLDHLERAAATLTPLRDRVEGVVYLAPANTLAFARQTPRLPHARYALMGLTDAEERTEVGQISPLIAGLYPRTVLYLISNALEDQRGTPLLGMQRYLTADSFRGRFQTVTWVPTPQIQHFTHTGFLSDPAIRAWVRGQLGLA